ncbi:MAG TPA: hypothetical protein VLW75_11330, partial [Rhizomicrobium sp.]|nr:hypothetical protein [Rhizomicrobium sp.]
QMRFKISPNKIVMAALVAAIHKHPDRRSVWMAGTGPAMTNMGRPETQLFTLKNLSSAALNLSPSGRCRAAIAHYICIRRLIETVEGSDTNQAPQPLPGFPSPISRCFCRSRNPGGEPPGRVAPY